MKDNKAFDRFNNASIGLTVAYLISLLSTAALAVAACIVGAKAREFPFQLFCLTVVALVSTIVFYSKMQHEDGLAELSNQIADLQEKLDKSTKDEK